MRNTNEGEKNGEENREKQEGAMAGEVYTNALGLSSEPSLRIAKRARNSNLIFENLIWLTSSEAAEYLRLPSVGALRVLVFKRQVPFHKLGRNLRFKKTELDRLLDASRYGGI